MAAEYNNVTLVDSKDSSSDSTGDTLDFGHLTEADAKTLLDSTDDTLGIGHLTEADTPATYTKPGASVETKPADYTFDKDQPFITLGHAFVSVQMLKQTHAAFVKLSHLGVDDVNIFAEFITQGKDGRFTLNEITLVSFVSPTLRQQAEIETIALRKRLNDILRELHRPDSSTSMTISREEKIFKNLFK